jgi:hypothetical protein
MISPPSSAVKQSAVTNTEPRPDITMTAMAPAACSPNPSTIMDGLSVSLRDDGTAALLDLLERLSFLLSAATIGLVPMHLLQASSLSHPYSASHFDGVIFTYITIITI